MNFPVTYLFPHSSQVVSKIFTEPSRSGKIGSSCHPKHFRVGIAEYSHLRDFAADLPNHPGGFIIYGAPNADLINRISTLEVSQGRILRRLSNFQERSTNHLHVFDIDGWDFPEDVDLTDQESVNELVRGLLVDRGMISLSDCDFAIVLSSSMWPGSPKLNCHLYFLFDEFISLDGLRSAVRCSSVEFDPAMYNPVQEQYFNPPQCQGFTDPIPQRIWFSQGDRPMVVTSDLLFNLQPKPATSSTSSTPTTPTNTLAPAGADTSPNEGNPFDMSTKPSEASSEASSEGVLSPGDAGYQSPELKAQLADMASSTPSSSFSPGSSSDPSPLGSDWLDTIHRYVGTDRGVNEPAYRSAAQLVESKGKVEMTANLPSYASEMYEAVWSTLEVRRNAGETTRGGEDDRLTYDHARFRQYLTSALGKAFGNPMDQAIETVKKAIIDSKAGLGPQALTSDTFLDALRRVKRGNTPEFIRLRADILATKFLNKTDLNELLKPPKSPSVSLGNGSGVAGPDEEMGDLEFMELLIGKYAYTQDETGNIFMKDTAVRTGYELIPLKDIPRRLLMEGLKIRQSIGANFQGQIMMILGDKFTQPGFLERVAIAQRRHVVPGEALVNFGKQSDGIDYIARVTPDGLKLATKDSTLPVHWLSGVEPMAIANATLLKERFGENYSTKLPGYLMEALSSFISIDRDGLKDLVAWAVSVWTNADLCHILEIVGNKGTGKSTCSDFMKDLVDPSGELGRNRGTLGSKKADFVRGLAEKQVNIIDNLSVLSPDQQDFFCGVATGTSMDIRILYTQLIDTVHIKRNLILTSLGTTVTRSDLRSRTVSVLITPSDDYRPQIREEWIAEVPYLRAALLVVCQGTLSNLSRLKALPEEVSPREATLVATHGFLEGKNVSDFTQVVAQRTEEAWNEIHDSRFIWIFLIYLEQAYPENTPGLKVILNTRGLHQKMHAWATDHAGERIDGRFLNLNDIPKTGKSLGWKLAKSIDSINKVSDWKIHLRNSSKRGKQYEISRK